MGIAGIMDRIVS